MGSSNVELEVLLKNIHQGLSIYSVSELNEALVKVLSFKHDKTHEIQYVISIVCRDFNITEYALKNIKNRGNLQDAKQIAYCLLHFNLGLSQRFIAESIFFNWPNSVVNGIKRFKRADVLIKQDREFIERYNYLRQKLLTYIQEKTITQHENLPKEREEKL